MTDALAALGLLSLVTSGALDLAMNVAIVLGLLGALFLPERWQTVALERRVGVVASLGLLGVQVLRLALGAELLPVAVEFAAGLQVVRLATRRGAAHDQQVVLLALLHLVAGTVLGGGLAYGLCFLGFLVVAPGALVLSHLRREVEGNYRQGARDRTGLPVDVPRILRSRRVIGRSFLAFTCLLALPIFIFTAALFVMFPRVSVSLFLLSHGRAGRMTGFSDRVDLGHVGALHSDPTLVMRVEAPTTEEPPGRLALYLRGTALDYYDGRAWLRTVRVREPASRAGGLVRLRRSPDPANDVVYTIDLEPIDPPVVFLRHDTVAIELVPLGATLLGQAPALWHGGEDELRYTSADDRGLRYRIYAPAQAVPVAAPLTAADRARYLALPPGLPERIGELARTWAGGETDPARVARRIEQRLRDDFTYSVDGPSGAAPNPLEHFLFESRRGHCEFFSTAMAVMLRTLEVPTRNVTGFGGGTYNRFGRYYAVRQGDAHSWVEVWIAGVGWQRFDPTPAAERRADGERARFGTVLRDLVEAMAQRWDQNVVGYDLEKQLRVWSFLRRGTSGESPWLGRVTLSPRRVGATLVGAALLVGAAVWLWRRRRRAAAGAEERPAETPEAESAIQLYRLLERSMATAGVARPAATPPLAHARAVGELAHPFAAEILVLTRVYLEARFGGRVLTPSERREFASRARGVGQRPERAAS
ncbi:MAG: DUF3488 domain-containing protein [Polyangiaceae bacterium]|nr:DUF3488 domain-containing protein [Polyangiaceae bacterium]